MYIGSLARARMLAWGARDGDVMPQFSGNFAIFYVAALTESGAWITVPPHAVARRPRGSKQFIQRREEAPRGRRTLVPVRQRPRTGSSFEPGWIMNRLATQPIAFNPPPVSTHSPLSLPLDSLSGPGAQVEAPPRPAMRPAVFCPLHYEPGYPYPLIVWLHDAGENEQVLRRVVPRISLRNYVAVAPRGTAADAAPGSTEEEFTWLHDADHFEQAEERVLDAVGFVRKSLNVSPERVFVAGKGKGGTMALRLAFEHPQRFAGAISLDGFLPRQGLPLARVNDLRRLPVLLTVRVTESLDRNCLREDELLLHAAGIPYTRKAYSGEDAAALQMLVDLDRWIMAHVCQPAAQRNAD